MKRSFSLRLLSFIFSIVLLVSFSVPSFASEIKPENLLYPTITYSTESDPETQVPNLISLDSRPRADGTGIDVHVGNLGVDGLDSVKVTVSATGHTKSQIQTSYVPIAGKTFHFDLPMIVCDTTYRINAIVVDGSGTQTFNRTAKISYSEEKLSQIGWGRGTFSSRQRSVNYHFDKHHNNIGVILEQT